MRLGRPVSARTVGTTAAALTVAAVLLVGCGSSDDKPDAGPTPTSPATSADATPGPSDSGTPSSSPTLPATGAGQPGARLLTAGELPRLSAAAPWTQGTTGPADPQPVAACNDADLRSIGARSVVARTYTADAAEAVEQVATFPDAMTTVRASRVLASFRDTCVSRVKDLAKLKVSDPQQIGVVGGKGWWYLASWLPAGTAGGHFQSVGVVVGTRTIALVVMDHEGQDHDYPPNGDPMIAAVKAAAAKLAPAA
jgi:hypothetical protein